ncbi:hypothetical protein PAMP_017349 [Pampus punctatissimus]
MKKGALNFLGRKNQSLFDTNIKMKDMDNVELVLGSSVISDSGTASVRARPTVKHHASSSESFQGFAVPTPKVPLLPPVNGPKTNGSVGGDQLSNGSVISVPDLVEGEILVPPPPSVAPPPPPVTFIPPPPDFMGDLNSPDLAILQPHSMPTPKPMSLAPFMEEDLTNLKPPPMAPPKPPSTCSNSSTSSVPISSPSPAKVPDHPKFAPPQTPIERQQKTSKTPPPKPIRLSSICNLDSPPQTPAPPPPVQTPALSTFNPQNKAKLYSVPKLSILSGYEDRDTRPKQMLLLEDSGSVKSAPVLVQVNGKTPKVAPPSKPISKDVKDVKENLQITLPSQSPLPEPEKEANTVSTEQETEEHLQTPHQTSPQLQKVNSTQMNSEAIQGKLKESPGQSRKFSPLLERKLRNLKSSETTGAREGPAASPLALLMAAKQREKHRSTLSRENSTKTSEQPSASIHQSDLSPNSFIVIPRSSSSSSLTSQVRCTVEDMQTIQTPEKSYTTPIKNQIPSTSPTLCRTAEAASPSVSNLVVQKLDLEQSLPKSQSLQHEDKKEELSMPLLPPPPEFDDFDEIMEPPPSICPPDPPMKKASIPTVSSLPPAQVPLPPPKPNPPCPPAAPKLPAPSINTKPKLQVQTKPQVAATQVPSTLSHSQATLLSILQKKMLEMDHKLTPMKDADSSSDDWGTSLSNEDNRIPVVPKATPQSNNYPVAKKTAMLDMQELEGKVVKKYQETSSKKATTSNGPQSKHQYGMTFTVRPGTKQPITLVGKEDSS